MENQKEFQWDDFSERKPHRNVALIVEDRKFWVSKEGLADYSSAFSKLFYAEFAESEISLLNKNADVILQLLRCLFPTKGLKKQIDYENVAILSKFADEYQIEYLENSCSKFLESITEGNDGLKKAFSMAVDLKQKKVVRSILPFIARFELADLHEILQNVPDLVRFAIFAQILGQGKVHDRNGYSSACSSVYCGLAGLVSRPLQRCYICFSCLKPTVLDREQDLASQKCCRCIYQMAAAELEKMNL